MKRSCLDDYISKPGVNSIRKKFQQKESRHLELKFFYILDKLT